jgi:hypothetical protein
MDITTRLREVPTMGHDAGCVIEAAEEIEQLRSALRGMLALDEENSQRGHDDNDVCAEVQSARALLVPNA